MDILEFVFCDLMGPLYLWSNVVRGTAERRGPVLSKHILLAHAKICYLYVSLMVQHHIV